MKRNRTEGKTGEAKISGSRLYTYWLCNIPGVGNASIRKLLKTFGSPEAVYHGNRRLWAQVLHEKQVESMGNFTQSFSPVESYYRMQQQGIYFVTPEEEEYPTRLRNIPDAPVGLFYKGRLPLEESLSIAVIGARECSEYGRYVATELGRLLGKRGITVISGMARGIDGISQKAALDVGGYSCGIMGCGVDICYPAQNRRVYDSLIDKGCILSTYPPGTPARPQNFPPRNRIVSGMADIVVVIEARKKSGTLITVDMALEQGKEIYVVPGRITDRLSDGCNGLLKQGAGVLLSPELFLEEVAAGRLMSFRGKGAGLQRGPVHQQQSEQEERQGTERPIGQMSEMEAGKQGSKMLGEPWQGRQVMGEPLGEIYKLLDYHPKTVAQIMEALPDTYHAQNVMALLMRLCMENLALQVSPGQFSRK